MILNVCDSLPIIALVGNKRSWQFPVRFPAITTLQHSKLVIPLGSRSVNRLSAARTPNKQLSLTAGTREKLLRDNNDEIVLVLFLKSGGRSLERSLFFSCIC
jgi:hypothetical protein